MNFNISKKKDYKLQGSLTHEMINLYGIPTKLMMVSKIGRDDLVFGDYSHLKTDKDKIFDITGLPEVSEDWDDINMNFSEFGLVNTENVRLFFSRKSVDKIFGDFDGSTGFSNIIGNLLVLPNNKIMEITDIDFQVPGINNLFTQSDVKNVYKFTLVPYNNKLVDEVLTSETEDIVGDYATLDTYFNELSDNTDVEQEAEVSVDSDTNKTVVDTSEDSVFGRF